MRHTTPTWQLLLLFPLLLFLSLACTVGSDGYEDQVERAEKLVREGDSQGAIRELRAAAFQV